MAQLLQVWRLKDFKLVEQSGLACQCMSLQQWNSFTNKPTSLFVLPSSICEATARDHIWTVFRLGFLLVLRATPTPWRASEQNSRGWSAAPFFRFCLLGWFPCSAQGLLGKGNWNAVGGTLLTHAEAVLLWSHLFCLPRLGPQKLWAFSTLPCGVWPDSPPAEVVGCRGETVSRSWLVLLFHVGLCWKRQGQTCLCGWQPSQLHALVTGRHREGWVGGDWLWNCVLLRGRADRRGVGRVLRD